MLPFHGLPHYLIDNFFGCTEDICFHGITIYHSLTKILFRKSLLMSICSSALPVYLPWQLQLIRSSADVLHLFGSSCVSCEKKSFHSSRCFTSVFPEINSEDAIFSLMCIL